MNLIERYVFREWLKAFVLVLGFLCGLTLLQDLANNLGDFRNYGASMESVCRYYFCLLPGYLPWLIPISLFISILLSLGGMARRNEIVALRACGTSLPIACRLVLVAALALAGCVYGLNSEWAPWSVEETRELKESFLRDDQVKRGLPETEIGTTRNIRFDNKRSHRLWHINRFNEITKEAYDLQVFVRDSTGVELYRISAALAWRDRENGTWQFRDGRYMSFRTDSGLYRYSAAKGLMVSGPNISPDVNSTQLMNLPRIPQIAKTFDLMELRDFDEKPEIFALLRKKPKDLSLRELNQALQAFPSVENTALRPLAIRRREILLAPLGCLFAAFIAIPFSVAGSRRGTGAGLARALGLFVCYYLVLTAANSLGEAGVLGAEVAGSLPSIVMALLAGFLLWRSR